MFSNLSVKAPENIDNSLSFFIINVRELKNPRSQGKSKVKRFRVPIPYDVAYVFIAFFVLIQVARPSAKWIPCKVRSSAIRHLFSHLSVDRFHS